MKFSKDAQRVGPRRRSTIPKSCFSTSRCRARSAGRRDVRALILELRDAGRTIFFSSHILSDAEALCSRVAIVAKGRLAAAGRLADLQEFAVQGWELVMANVPAAALDRVRARARGVVTIAADRYAIDIAPDGHPEDLLRELTAAGATLVSLNPVRETLEDVFVRRVAAIGDGARPPVPEGRTR
jgi:ABC-2 type transport system ATP-binding protein